MCSVNGNVITTKTKTGFSYGGTTDSPTPVTVINLIAGIFSQPCLQTGYCRPAAVTHLQRNQVRVTCKSRKWRKQKAAESELTFSLLTVNIVE
jgi:hypothetical protein